VINCSIFRLSGIHNRNLLKIIETSKICWAGVPDNGGVIINDLLEKEIAMNQLTGKIAVITGGSRGLGRATAIRLAKDGALVVISYHNHRDRAEEVIKEITQNGGKAFAVPGDVSSVLGIKAFYESVDAVVRSQTGNNQFDILANNAGIIHNATIEQTDENMFDRLFNLNAKGAFFVIQQALPRLRDGGRIINLSTGLTRFSYPQYIAYAATKGAIEVVTRMLAQQLGSRGITVNTIAPGPIDTDLNADWLRHPEAQERMASVTALNRVGQVNDIADVMSFLASQNSRWVTAQRIEVSGGLHL
jgi:3-oxoacyl-[acyl-carrier protein] reductase